VLFVKQIQNSLIIRRKRGNKQDFGRTILANTNKSGPSLASFLSKIISFDFEWGSSLNYVIFILIKIKLVHEINKHEASAQL